MPRTVVDSEAGLEALGGEVGALLGAADVVFLAGPLGAGKTTFARGLVRAAGHAGTVKSPTFTLVEPYEALEPPIYHFDLYRIADPEELELVGFRDYLARGIVLIEWPERLGKDALQPDLAVDIVPTPGGREVTLEARTSRLDPSQLQRITDNFTKLT